MWKKIFACFLICLLVAIPLVQRSYAAVTTITVVTILILTILTAMGITLVVADGTQEAFIADKGDSFMSAKGYSGSFADWISGGTPMDISLKLGTLMVAKAVVDRIKEFVDWLVPGAASNTVVDIGSGSVTAIDSIYLVSCSVTSNSLVVDAIGQDHNSYPITLTDGVNWSGLEYHSNGYGYCWANGRYINGTFVPQENNFTYGGFTQLFYIFVSSSFIRNGKTCPSGIYAGYRSGNSFEVSPVFYNTDAVGPIFLPSSLDPPQNADGQAIIGDYDDLSDLTTTTTEGSGGTTIVNNTFYVTQSGQALNPSSQDLADIVGALQQALDDLEDRMKVQPMTADAEAATQVEPPYNDFQLGNLDLSQLGALLTTRFPFSIPWDLKRIFDLFVVDPEAPHWELNLFADSSLTDAGVDGSVSVDLGNFPIIGTVTRWFCIIEFCLFLAAETKKYIWTA